MAMATRHNPKVRTIQRSEIDLLKFIASGSFGEVWKGNWVGGSNSRRRQQDQKVAVKIMKNADRRQVYVERDRMVGLDHPNVVKMLGVVEFEYEKYAPWIVLEYIPLGDLKTNLQNGSYFCAKCSCKIVRGIAFGMEYLHSKGLVHGDLAARNCLLGSDYSIKVGDLGYFDSANSEYYLYNDFFPCPVRWMPPENLPYRLNRYSEMVSREPFRPKRSFEGDVWAYGIIMFELWSGGKVPFERIQSQADVAEALLNGYKPTDYNKVEMCEHTRKWMHKCWKFTPSARPNFTEIVDCLEENDGLFCDH